MPTYNPALEGATYCKKSTGATWYANGNLLFSITQENLINGTSYRTENLPNNVTISWDRGSYSVKNPDNYSYKIIKNNFWQAGISYRNAQGRVTGIRYTRPWFDTGVSTVRACYSGNNAGMQYRLSNGQISGVTSFLYNELVTQEIYPNGSGDCSTIFIQRAKDGTGFAGNTGIKLEIKDGNETNLFDINNANSVSVSDTPNPNKRFIFTAGSLDIKPILHKNTILSLKCGIDCPPKTCFKCRSGNQVCCYGSDGTVIDIVDDPDNEIQGVC